MSDPRRRIGRRGEAVARERLKRMGYRVIEANYRATGGEIDLAAAAQEYLQSHQANDAEWRIDLAAIEFGPNGTVTRFDVLQNAIEL